MNDNDFLLKDKFMHYKKGNVYLSKEQEKILLKYGIEYLKYDNLKDILFEVEVILNSGYVSDELEMVSRELGEFLYYHDTDK